MKPNGVNELQLAPAKLVCPLELWNHTESMLTFRKNNKQQQAANKEREGGKEQVLVRVSSFCLKVPT